MEMVERVARSQSEFDGRPWLAMSKSDRDRYMQRAIVAIEAMSVPTKSMIEAGDDAIDIDEDDINWNLPSQRCWNAMIDAALKTA